MKTLEHYDDCGLREERLPWTQDPMCCRQCGYQWQAVRTVGSDFYRLECTQCGAFDSEPVDL